jgi:hypothetical protein
MFIIDHTGPRQTRVSYEALNHWNSVFETKSKHVRVFLLLLSCVGRNPVVA